MSDEYAKSSDIERLEEQIANLRLVVIVLTIIVSFSVTYSILQLISQESLLPLLAAVGVIILCLFLLTRSCTKDSGASAGN